MEYAADNVGTTLGLSIKRTTRGLSLHSIVDFLLTASDHPSWRKRVDKNMGFPATNKPMKQRMEELLAKLSTTR